MKEVIELQKIRAEIKELKKREAEINDDIIAWLHEQDVKTAKTPYGTLSIRSRKRYNLTEEVEAIKEELKAQEEDEKGRAITREQWDSLGKPSGVPIYDITEFLAFTAKKEDIIKEIESKI